MNLMGIEGLQKSQNGFNYIHNPLSHISTQQVELNIKKVKCFIPINKGFVLNSIITIKIIIVVKAYDNNQ
jgi:hypothetical protein